jgi:hypothetical protein
VSDVYPSPGSVGIPLRSDLQIHVHHLNGRRINVTFWLYVPDDDVYMLSRVNRTASGVFGAIANETFYSYFGFNHTYFQLDKTNNKFFWYVNITDGSGYSRNFPNTTMEYNCYNFTTKTTNGSNLTFSDTLLNATLSKTSVWGSNGGWTITSVAESQLNIQETLVNCTAINVSHWVSPFWDIWFNATGTGNGTGNASGSVIVNVNGRSFTWFFTVGLFGGVSFGMVLWRRKRRKEG